MPINTGMYFEIQAADPAAAIRFHGKEPCLVPQDTRQGHYVG